MKICSGIFALFLFFAFGALAQGPRESGFGSPRKDLALSLTGRPLGLSSR